VVGRAEEGSRESERKGAEESRWVKTPDGFLSSCRKVGPMGSLEDIGLSEYEARSYRALLSAGPTTAKELSRTSEVPMGRIYDVLGSLETHGLARSQTASRPKKYVAVEPAAGLDRLLEDRKRELDAQRERYEALVEELVGELDAAETDEGTFWTAAVGPVAAVDLLSERLAAADSEVVFVASTLSRGFDADIAGDRISEQLVEAIGRGVEVSFLMRPALAEVMPGTVGERYETVFAPAEEFHVRTSRAVDATVTVIDGDESCIEVGHPLDDDRLFAMIDLKDRSFATELRDAFETHWERANPLDLEAEV
jgi:sugar-specific transcriptional regulator TrmB